MSPSTLAEDYFDTLGRHISTYNTRNTIQGTNPPLPPPKEGRCHIYIPPSSPKNGRCHLNIPLLKKASNPKRNTNPNTVGSYFIVGVMEKSGQKILIIRDSSMLKTSTSIIKNQSLKELWNALIPTALSLLSQSITVRTDSHKLFCVMKNDPKQKSSKIKLERRLPNGSDLAIFKLCNHILKIHLSQGPLNIPTLALQPLT